MPTASLAWLYLLPMDPQTVPSTTLSCQYHQQLLQYDCTVRSSTSLILTDLLTRGQNYSFAVAVTDSTGQHGPWSDQLMVTCDGLSYSA